MFTQQIDPRIGVVIREGREVFYAHANGYENPPIYGTLREVEEAISPRPMDKKEKVNSVLKKRTFRAVAISPEGVEIAYMELWGRNKTEARKGARQAYRQEVPAPSVDGAWAFEECKLVWLDDEE